MFFVDNGIIGGDKMKYSFLFFMIFIISLSGCAQKEENIKRIYTPIPTQAEAETNAPKSRQAQNIEPQEKEKRNQEEKKDTICEQLISQSETILYDKTENRINNITLAANAVNEYLLPSGETFSFNSVVGDRTEEKGYKKAPVLFHSERIYDFGGGVCQLSTTLFQAAKKAGFKITEQNPHKKEVDYAKQGEDAAVDYPSLDLKFINTSNCDVMIYAAVTEECVVVHMACA